MTQPVGLERLASDAQEVPRAAAHGATPADAPDPGEAAPPRHVLEAHGRGDAWRRDLGLRLQARRVYPLEWDPVPVRRAVVGN